jgi:hypothetical protein
MAEKAICRLIDEPHITPSAMGNYKKRNKGLHESLEIDEFLLRYLSQLNATHDQPVREESQVSDSLVSISRFEGLASLRASASHALAIIRSPTGRLYLTPNATTSSADATGPVRRQPQKKPNFFVRMRSVFPNPVLTAPLAVETVGVLSIRLMTVSM